MCTVCLIHLAIKPLYVFNHTWLSGQLSMFPLKHSWYSSKILEKVSPAQNLMEEEVLHHEFMSGTMDSKQRMVYHEWVTNS